MVGACTLICKDAFWWTVFLLSAPKSATGSAPITQTDCLLSVLIFGERPCVLGTVRGAKIQQRGETGKALPVPSLLRAADKNGTNTLLCSKNWAFVPGPWQGASKVLGISWVMECLC